MESRSDLIKCFICSENIKEARILPCFHSFCFDCLKKRFEDVISNCKKNMPNCPQCELPFEMPEGGIKNLKKNEFIDNIITGRENASLSRQTTCEVCLEKNATKYCVDCKQDICVSCVMVHEKFQSLKDHVLLDIRVNGVKTNDVKYCKSCSILLHDSSDDDDSMSHKTCIVVDLSEFKNKIHKSLLNNLEQSYQNLSSIDKYLKHFDEKNQSVTEDAESLKKQIQYQRENLRRYIEIYIDGCFNDLNECIDEDYRMIQKKLILSQKQLFELKNKLQQQIENNKNNLQDLNQETVIEAINDNLIGKMEHSAISADGMIEHVLSALQEKSTFYFEPTVFDQIFSFESNIVGILRQGCKFKLKPVKVINDMISLRNCSIDGIKLYGLNSKNMKKLTLISFPCTVLVSHPKANESLYSTNVEISLEKHVNGTLVNRFLCVANSSSEWLTIIDLKEKKDTPGWQKEVHLSFEIENLFPSSNENIFVLSSLKIFEITLNGNIVKEIHLPSAGQLSGLSSKPTGFVNLENDCYGAIYSGQLHVIDIHGNVTRKFVTKSLHCRRKIDNFVRMVTDKSSNMFVTSSTGQEIFVFDYNLNYIKQLEAQCIPTCLCYDSRRNRLLVFGDKELNVFQL